MAEALMEEELMVKNGSELSCRVLTRLLSSLQSYRTPFSGNHVSFERFLPIALPFNSLLFLQLLLLENSCYYRKLN
jgi:hypothetical protein